MLCWVRDALLFTWVAGAVLMIADEGDGKTFGFWLLWLGLAGWPIIMVLGHRLQEKAKDVERQYRPYIRGWFSWQAVGWVILGMALVLYMRSFVRPWVMMFSHRGGENSVELAEGRLIVVAYTLPPNAMAMTLVYGLGGPQPKQQNYLAWTSLSSEIASGRSGLRGQTNMRHTDGRLLNCEYVVIPLIGLLPVALIWPIAWGGRIRSIERRRKANQCPNCGYDLRESPQQCPECGREVMRLLERTPDEMEEGQIIADGDSSRPYRWLTSFCSRHTCPI